MGQTLPNGIYLPAEGERNCYDGLEGNWRSLDSLISTVAGKASATHTHGNITNDGKVGTAANKPLITGTGGAVQAGSFGNQANTFCEGNDSRLSDARTPVAHTHTKSDVTDLLNSNFIPSANNSYDLGSSSYQWNNLYAKNYYYNGTAWGLGQANVWTQSQTIKNTDYQIGEIPSAAKARYINFTDKNNVNIGWIQRRVESSGDSSIEMFVYNRFTNSQPDTAGTQDYAMLKVGLKSDQTHFCEITGDTYPRNNNTYDLGTSTNKWKTLNGVNPGALSLPGTGGFTNIKGDITNLSGGDNTFTAPYDGWVCVKSTNATVIHIINTVWAVSQSATQSTAGTLCCLCPVMSGQSFRVIVNATRLDYAYIHPCKGNV